jgi:hypothetical protein
MESIFNHLKFYFKSSSIKLLFFLFISSNLTTSLKILIDYFIFQIFLITSINSYLNFYTVHSLNLYDKTTKIAFTKYQLSPDNS